MRATTPHRTAITLALAFALAVTAAPGAAPAPSDLDSMRREAEELEARLEEQGRRLSLADEDYNEARLQRERLERRVARTRADLSRAEERWNELKSVLGERVRELYKHPGAYAEAWLGARSLSDLARARAFAGSVVLTDTELLMKTERARAEMTRRADELGELQARARREEQELEARQQEVRREMASQRALLQQVEGDISEVIDERRAREAREAARRAEAAARATPTPQAPARQSDPDPPAGSGADPAPPQQDPPAPAPAVRGSAATAVQTARDQIGKPYEWGAAGPNSFDCSGLTQYAWKAAGVSLPHSSRAQYSSLPKVSLAEIQPGDLLFFGNPIHHVGIYEGGGIMIEAPYTGEYVRRRSIYRSDFTGAARP